MRMFVPRGSHHVAVVCFVICASASITRAETGRAFSSLPDTHQHKIREFTSPPPPHERYGCYSTPMYYLMYEGYEYRGDMDMRPADRVYVKNSDTFGPHHGTWKLDRNRPDWQEAMVRDWAELGLNSTHLNIYPEDERLELSDAYRAAIVDYVRLSKKYGLKVGVRLDALGGYEAWPMNPDNPENLIEPYLAWVRRIAGILRGQTAYYVLGDELTLHKSAPDLSPRTWTPEKYLGYFKQVTTAIKDVDPDAKVSMFAASSGEWFNILYLLEKGYAEYGDGVAINYYNYQKVPEFFADAARLAPDLEFYSNGVGYTSCAKAQPRYPEGDPYSALPDEIAHGKTVAKNMFAWWDLGASTAPYYVSLRNWVIRDRVYPRWFGFFGFQDFVIDEFDNMTVKHYPGWYAFQTVAHTFYNRDTFRKPSFEVASSEELSMFRAYEHDLDKGSELVMMMWNDKGQVETTITVATNEYLYPVRVSTFNCHEWSDMPYDITPGSLSMKVKVDPGPVIIRLVRIP